MIAANVANSGNDEFYTPDYAEQKSSLNTPFSSVYVCHGVLPKQIVFKEIKKI